MKRLVWFFLISTAFAAQATPPTIVLAAGPYSGTQETKITDANAGTKITACTNDGTTPTTNNDGINVTNGFAIRTPGYYPVGATLTLKCVTSTATLTDSTVASAAYTITAATISADTFGYQCQSSSVNCAAFTFPLVNGTPLHFRIWDCSSPFYSTAVGGTNCNWASIESTAAGVYTWTALDSWLIAIDAYRILHPTFQVAYTMGMMPCTEATLPTGFSVTKVTAVSGSGTSGTTTYSGNFGSTTLLGMYITVSGMANSNNNIAINPNGTGTGVAAVTAWAAGSVTITGQAGVVDLSAQTGTLNGVPGPKGCGKTPDDLPVWNGVPPMPTNVGGACAGQLGSCAFNTFVTALVNHCAAGHPTICFYNEINAIEGWNEPNNNFFCIPGYCSIQNVYQMLAGGLPIIRAKMDGTGGTNKVSVQSIASTASAAATNAVMAFGSANGMLDTVLAFHQYLGNATSGAPEAVATNMNSIINQRAGNAGWNTIPWRQTETSWNSTQNPYGCSQGSPWTLNDCIGQMLRWQLVTMCAGATGVDWYNWDVNIGKIAAYQSAYYYQQNYVTGGTIGSCTNAGANPATYQVAFTEANGTTALFVWGYCATGASYATCAANGTSFTVPANYVDYRDLSGNKVNVTGGQVITIGVQPFFLEQSQPANSIPPAPAAIFTKVSYLDVCLSLDGCTDFLN